MNAPLPSLGTFATILESARQTVVLSLRDRLWWIVAAAMVLLPMLALLLSARVHERIDGRDLFCVLCWWLHGTVVVPWLTLYLGIQAVHGRIEDRTFQYLFLRPVHRATLLLGSWIAVSLMAAVAAVGGTVLLFAAVAAQPDRWSDGVENGLLVAFGGAFVVAAPAYAAAAMFFAACCRRPLVWAAFFVVGLQTLAANLPVSAGLRSMTITDPVRRLLLDRIEPDRQLAAMLWPAEHDFRPELIGEPLRDLCVFVVTMLVAAAWCYTRREFDSRERE